MTGASPAVPTGRRRDWFLGHRSVDPSQPFTISGDAVPLWHASTTGGGTRATRTGAPGAVVRLVIRPLGLPPVLQHGVQVPQDVSHLAAAGKPGGLGLGGVAGVGVVHIVFGRHLVFSFLSFRPAAVPRGPRRLLRPSTPPAFFRREGGPGFLTDPGNPGPPSYRKNKTPPAAGRRLGVRWDLRRAERSGGTGSGGTEWSGPTAGWHARASAERRGPGAGGQRHPTGGG